MRIGSGAIDRLAAYCRASIALLGTHERIIGFLIEHYAGNFPLWLAPEQVRVLTLNDDE